MAAEITYKLDLQEINELRKRLSPKNLRGLNRRALGRLIRNINYDVMLLTPVWKGNAQTSIKHTIEGDPITGLVGRVFTDELYVKVQEEGRKPGGKMPPVGVLWPWIEDKIDRTPKSDNDQRPSWDFDYIIGRKIAEVGTKGYHMFKRTAEKYMSSNYAIIKFIFDEEYRRGLGL